MILPLESRAELLNYVNHLGFFYMGIPYLGWGLRVCICICNQVQVIWSHRSRYFFVAELFRSTYGLDMGWGKSPQLWGEYLLSSTTHDHPQELGAR